MSSVHNSCSACLWKTLLFRLNSVVSVCYVMLFLSFIIHLIHFFHLSDCVETQWFMTFSRCRVFPCFCLSNVSVLVCRESPCFSLGPALPVSFYHPTVHPLLHPPNHPLPPPSWTGPLEGICAVCLCWWLGASRRTGKAHNQYQNCDVPLPAPGLH